MPSEALPCVATLIAAAPDASTNDLVDALRTMLPGAGAVQWLAPARAFDLSFTATAEHLPDLRSAVVQWRGKDRPVDVILQPRANRRKKLLLADMDSTMIGQECIDELADFAGLKPMVAAITERAMRGELAFETALLERVALLKGLPVSVVDAVLNDRITLTPGGRALVATMRGHGAYCALVSGGFTLFTGPVAARLGFHENRGNTLAIENETLAGTLVAPIVGREAKLAALVELRALQGLGRADTLAVGDGANDLAMIAEAGLGVAFHAKPAVAAAASGRIDHNDLTALLFAQGYAVNEITQG